jgi:hypothetical protein
VLTLGSASGLAIDAFPNVSTFYDNLIFLEIIYLKVYIDFQINNFPSTVSAKLKAGKLRVLVP